MKRLLTIFFALTPVLLAAQPRIEKITPITTDNQVRLEITLSTAKKTKASVSASIASCQDGTVIWSGELLSRTFEPGTSVIETSIDDIEAQLWTPATPHLYNITVSGGGSSAERAIGFRRFEMKDGKFYLNGNPIFLRGNAINPPNRGIPDELETSEEFARDYIRFLKGMNINIIRIPANQTWMDVCDQEGMMIFAGRYGRPRGGTPETPPSDLDAAVEYYKETELGPFTPHPSMVIYVLSNEQAHSGEPGKAYDRFLQQAYERLRQWDDTRLYIGNAGYGMGRSADIYDVHRYWGWYYNTFLTYLNLRDQQAWQNPGQAQPITFTECVGNYTGIDGRYNLCSRTKQPSSQLCWTGRTPQSEQGEAALDYQALVLKNATEMFRRMRSQNDRLAGVMPFTIMFHNWDGVKSFSEMTPKPAAYQYGVSYQPVLLSWEVWAHNLYAGNSFDAVIHIVNDDDNFHALQGATVDWALEDINRHEVTGNRIELPEVPYYATHRMPVSIKIPADLPSGYYTLRGSILENGKVISQNSAEVFVAGTDWENPSAKGRKIRLYDLKGTTAKALTSLGVSFSTVDKFTSLKAEEVLVIGEKSWDETLAQNTAALVSFTSRGGRIICLRQERETFDTQWLPVDVKMLRHSNNSMQYLSPSFAYSDGMNINIAREGHPVFEGIERDKLRLWSDWSGFDQTKEGFPMIYPVTQGFDLAGADFTKVSVLADYSRGLAATALFEVLHGKGSIVVSGFDLSPRAEIDPIAARLLNNIMRYAACENLSDPYTFVDEPIYWGNFESENGIVSVAHNGLILNTVPVIPLDQRNKLKIIVDKMGFWYAGSYGGWNTKPGVQYMPQGRRPYAPFEYTRGGNIIGRGDDLAAEGFILARISAGKTTMVTTVQNPVREPITLEISVNGRSETHILAPASTTELTTPTSGKSRLKIGFKGDRRNVLLKTEFR